MRYSTANVPGGKFLPAPLAAGGGRNSPQALTAKRVYDIVLSGIGLVVLAPLFLLITLIFKLADKGEVFFSQIRVGQGGRTFRIYKFRTMSANSQGPRPSVTKAGDPRITRIGRLLRKSKLDELPQLWNVLKGDMSLVGPRPEVPCYVRHYSAEQRAILQHRPGITDLASLCFRDEEALLANAEDLEQFYLQQCLPRKLELNREYAQRATLWSDTWIILQTVCPYWAGVLICYGIILGVAFWLAFGLIDDFASQLPVRPEFWRQLGLVLAVELGCLGWRRQCRGLLSYFNYLELCQVGKALGLATLGLLAVSNVLPGLPPRNVILVDALLALLLLGGFRLGLRHWRERSSGEAEAPTTPPERVGIIGAGSMGAQLALELIANRQLGRTVVAFFDDDFRKWQKRIHDVPVVGMPECVLQGWTQRLDEVVIAMPSAAPDRVRAITQLLRQTSLKFHTAPSATSIWDRQQAA